MSFVIRQITKRADGGEIVRSQTIEGSELTVGRGSDSNIQLADLAVLLHHARIRMSGPGRATIEATGGVPVEVDGKFVNRADIDAAAGAKVVLGGHRLTFATADDPQSIAITVERVAPLSEAAEESDEAHVFTLKGAMPGKRAVAWTLVVLVLLGCLALPLFYFWDMHQPQPAKIMQADRVWISGPLSAAHAGLKDNCQACHKQAFVAVRDDSCLSCHKNVADHAAPDRLVAAHPDLGFQGKLRAKLATTFNLPEWSCTQCHKEHEGPGPMPLGGDNDCAGCHAKLTDKLGGTKLLNASDFKDAHPEFRPLVVAKPAPAGADPMLRRVSLADKPAENSGLKFPHDVHLSRSGGVARMAGQIGGRYDGPLDCGDCHTPDASGVRFRAIEMERDCASCHTLDFARADGMVRTLRHGDARQAVAEMRDFFRAGRAFEPAVDRRRPGQSLPLGPAGPSGGVEARIRAIFSPGGACYDCHVVTAPTNPRSLDFRIAPVTLADRYFTRGWFDHRDHDTADSPCASCHAAKTSKKASDLLIPGIAVCRDCHAGEHPKGDEIATPCASCHSYHTGPGAPRGAHPPRGAQPKIAGWTIPARPAT